MNITVLTRFSDESGREVEMDVVAENVSSADINQLIAGDIGPAAVVGKVLCGPQFTDADVVSWWVQ